MPTRRFPAPRRPRVRALTALALVAAVAACAPPPAPAGSGAPTTAPSAGPGTSAARQGGGAVVDSVGAAQIPAGYGTLRQEDISIRLQAGNVLIGLIPLDEAVIRTLSPDSYRTLRQIAESRRDQLTRLASLHALRERSVWYATFFGLAPEARFTPTDLTVTSAGREFRPLEVLALSSGFGEHRLQPREMQQALLLFDDGLDVSQPVTVTMSMVRNTDWADILHTIERERALIRSRAARPKNP